MFRVYLNSRMSVTMVTVIAPYMIYAIIYSRSHFLMSSRFSAGAGGGAGSGRVGPQRAVKPKTNHLTRFSEG